MPSFICASMFPQLQAFCSVKLTGFGRWLRQSFSQRHKAQKDVMIIKDVIKRNDEFARSRSDSLREIRMHESLLLFAYVMAEFPGSPWISLALVRCYETFLDIAGKCWKTLELYDIAGCRKIDFWLGLIFDTHINFLNGIKSLSVGHDDPHGCSTSVKQRRLDYAQCSALLILFWGRLDGMDWRKGCTRAFAKPASFLECWASTFLHLRHTVWIGRLWDSHTGLPYCCRRSNWCYAAPRLNLELVMLQPPGSWTMPIDTFSPSFRLFGTIRWITTQLRRWNYCCASDSLFEITESCGYAASHINAPRSLLFRI